MADEWVSITEAAKQLEAIGDKCTRSALSYYLKQHAEAIPVRKFGREQLVNINVLAAHRGANVRTRLAAVEGAGDGETQGKRGRPVQQVARFSGTQAEGAARKAQADAELKEMDLALRRRTLTPTSEVDRAARDAIALMMSSFDRAVDTTAASVSARNGWDERTARTELKAFVRTGVDIFHREVLSRLDDMKREEGFGDDDGEAVHASGTALQ